MVLQGLLDVGESLSSVQQRAMTALGTVVDNLLEISEAFRRQLTLLEARVLVQPEMDACVTSRSSVEPL